MRYDLMYQCRHVHACVTLHMIMVYFREYSSHVDMQERDASLPQLEDTLGGACNVLWDLALELVRMCERPRAGE